MDSPQPLFDPSTPFTFIGGDPSVDFVNTVDWTSRGPELDQFSSYERVLDWAGGAGLLDSGAVAQLRATAETNPETAEDVRKQAIQLRAMLDRLYFRIVSGERAWREIQELNSMWLRRSLAGLAVVDHGHHFALGWEQPGRSLDAPLWAVAWDTAKLLTSDDAARIRRCGGTNCGWYYVDRSRNGLRRWCAMETCGTRMKSRRRAERKELLRSSDAK